MHVIGLDIGTSGVKSTVFDDSANVLYHAYREYDLISRGDGQYELDPRILYQKTIETLKESTKKVNKKEIKAICATSFGESFVCLDENSDVIANTMIYMDLRGSEECDEYTKIFPEKKIFEDCGQFVDPMYAIYKMRWMNKNQLSVMKKVKRICFIADFITYKLGADHCCDYSLAARSGMFNVRTKQWIGYALDFAMIDASILPNPVPGGSVVGTVSDQVAEELGMTSDAKLIVGGHDQILAAMGSGALEEGDIANGVGTVDCFTAIMSESSLNMEKLLQYKFPVVPFLKSDKYVTYAFNMSGGCSVKWFRDTLAKDIADQEEAYVLLNREAPADPTGVFVLPYLAGAGTPYMDTQTPAVIAGLRLNTTRGKLFRAFLEGETYEMMLNIECLSDAGINIKKIITVGGGSRSSLWMQIRANVFNRTIYLPGNKEAGTLASALLCYANIGRFRSIEEAQKEMVRFDSKFIPDEKETKMYEKYYKKYKRLYTMIKELYQ